MAPREVWALPRRGRRSLRPPRACSAVGRASAPRRCAGNAARRSTAAGTARRVEGGRWIRAHCISAHVFVSRACAFLLRRALRCPDSRPSHFMLRTRLIALSPLSPPSPFRPLSIPTMLRPGGPLDRWAQGGVQEASCSRHIWRRGCTPPGRSFPLLLIRPAAPSACRCCAR